jgi:hypothetical protein
VRTFLIDPDSWLEIKEEDKRMVRGSERESEVIYGDYKEVGGLIYPFSMEQGQKGGQQHQKIKFSKIEQNVNVDDSRFKMPAAAPAAAPKADDKKPDVKKDEPKK